jgi:3-oxoacyl-[acyl-carrier protein] reductase
MLAGKRCLITGGSRGLGLALGLAFAREGAQVAFTYSQNDHDAEEARGLIAQAGAAPLVFKGSVADAKHVNKTVAELLTAWDGIDVLVNCAGINQVLPIALCDEADWDEMMAINVKGVFLYSRAVLKGMIKAKRGHILNIGSFASERMIEAPVHFAASKSAVRGFSEALAREMGRYNIQVNVLCPGLLDVGLAQALPKHRLDEYLGQCPLGRLARGDEIARFAVFLVSDRNTFMTGAKLAIDGGL